jgi:hypothetical protein
VTEPQTEKNAAEAKHAPEAKDAPGTKHASEAKDAGPETAPPKINWADPNVPAGNAPAMPSWPLFGSAFVFALWLAFLVAMAVIRVRTVSF